MRPLIYDEFDGEIAKDDNVRSSKSNAVKSQDELTVSRHSWLQLSEVHSSQTASHLEIQETAAADVDRLNHLEHLDLFVPKMEVVAKELLMAHKICGCPKYISFIDLTSNMGI